MKIKLLLLISFFSLLTNAQINQNFDGTITGWNFNNVTSTTSQPCSATKSLQYDAIGDFAITPAITNPNKLNFNIKRSGNSGAWSVQVQISIASPTNQTSGPWTTVATIGSTVMTSCSPITEIDLSAYSGLRYVKFLDNRPSGTNQRGIDDVSISIITTPVITPSTQSGTVGTAINYNVVANNTPTSYALASGDLPNGLTLNTATGLISGTPTVDGTFVANISATNGSGAGTPATITFNISPNTSCTAPVISSVYPTSGPVGTEVTVNFSSGNLVGATALFNGVAATIVSTSTNKIVVKILAGSTSGNLQITDSQPCQVSTPFVIIDKLITDCQGTSFATLTELFISEVTDSNRGALSYVEIYNGTGASVNLSSYSLQTASNGNAPYPNSLLLSGSLANNTVLVVALGTGGSTICNNAGGDGSLATITSGAGSVNFKANENDHIALFKNATKIDSFGTYLSNNWAPAFIGEQGATFRRKNNITPLPNITYNNSDWDITDYAGNTAADCNNNDYSDVGIYIYSAKTAPLISTQPNVSINCTTTSLTISVAASEGFVAGNALVYQWFELMPNTTTWAAINPINNYANTDANLATLNIANIAGLDGYQYYCQVRENTATCFKATNAVIIKDDFATTWTTSWSNGTPSATKTAIIDGTYDMQIGATRPSIDACNVIVKSGTLTVSANKYLNIEHNLSVNSGATLSVLDDASVIMINDLGVVTNNGITNVSRTTSPFEKYDYIYWTSPLEGTTLNNTFSTWYNNYAFSFNTPTFQDLHSGLGYPQTSGGPDTHDDNGDEWTQLPLTTSFAPAKGYIIMAPITGSFPRTETVTFSGKLNNGLQTFQLKQSQNTANNNDDYNLFGNPYASAISADNFIKANIQPLALNNNISGTIYLWTHKDDVQPYTTNPGPNVNNYNSNDYALYNLSGGTTTGFASGSGSTVPLGFIASGQSFFVEAETTNDLVFRNVMRNKTHNNTQFYRNANNQNATNIAPEKDRVWLNFSNTDNMFSQQLIAYIPDTSLDFDYGYDGKASASGNYVSFYSKMSSDIESVYKIQSRSGFDVNDSVQLGYFSAVSGTTTIGIDKAEGILNNPATNVYLQDNLLNITHDLKLSDYVFITNYGTFNDRFLLKYNNNSLYNNTFVDDENAIKIGKKENKINIHSAVENINKIEIFDILGRKIHESKHSDKTVSIENIFADNKALIVKLCLENGSVVLRKII